MIAEQHLPTVEVCPLQAGDALRAEPFQEIRRQMVLDCCKWDPQVGDVATISSFPLLLCQQDWQQLSRLAVLLSAELFAAELELLDRPDLHRQLGLPRGIRSVLRQNRKLGATPAAARVLRFDFHWTPDGWQISEVNSDVPGGFSEASKLPALMAANFPGYSPAGNPGKQLARTIAASISNRGSIAVIAAAGFMEDQQVVAYLSRQLNRIGLATHWALPQDLCWRDGYAHLNARSLHGPLGAIVRFFQAEWLNARRCRPMFSGGQTPITNPGWAILTESKRFPLVWDRLSTSLPTWRQLLPATADPRDADWLADDTWLLKGALCNTGESVAMRSAMNARQWHAVSRAVLRRPDRWIAQKRFATCAIPSPVGHIFPCLGVYTIDGQPAGIYGRYSRGPMIDYAAVDVAVLIADFLGHCQ